MRRNGRPKRRRQESSKRRMNVEAAFIRATEANAGTLDVITALADMSQHARLSDFEECMLAMAYHRIASAYEFTERLAESLEQRACQNVKAPYHQRANTLRTDTRPVPQNPLFI